MPSLLIASFFPQPQNAKATTSLGLASAPTITLNTSVDDVNLNITPTTSGVLASGTHTLTATTNTPTGYNLTISMPTAPALPTTTSTLTAPTPLADNTWGYATTSNPTSTTSNTITNNFDVSYAVPIPSDTSVWADPSIPTIIKNTQNSATSDTTTIYYGAKINTNIAAGTYTNTVLYTATANTDVSIIPAPTIISITPAQGPTAGNTPITIIGTNFTKNDQSVTTSVKIDGIDCLNPSISSNTPTLGEDTIYCDTPEHPTTGAVDVSVTTWIDTATATGAFTYIIATPTPTITAPEADQIFAAGTASTSLAVTTDFAATCYYGTTANPTTPMTTTGATSHSQSLSLTNGTTNTYHIRCQTAPGDPYSADQSITFYVRAAAPTSVTLSPTNGAALIYGTTSTPVSATPNTGTCTITKSSGTGTLSGSTVSGLSNGSTTTLAYSCTAGSGNTLSTARTGTWTFSVRQLPYIQAITTSNCPTSRTISVDARDSATYWVQKLADNKCWMLTNLAYGGAGTWTSSLGWADDRKTITRGSNSSTYYVYTDPYWFRPTNYNRTAWSANPSTSTDGGATNPQYGYLYNWCAAMGAQTTTSACSNANTPVPNTNISICPSGWHLPTSSEFTTLNTRVNSGSTTSSAGLRSTWLGQYSGQWNGGKYFVNQGAQAYYWSSTQDTSSAGYAYYLGFYANGANPAYALPKHYAYAVRCVAN